MIEFINISNTHTLMFEDVGRRFLRVSISIRGLTSCVLMDIPFYMMDEFCHRWLDGTKLTHDVCFAGTYSGEIEWYNDIRRIIFKHNDDAVGNLAVAVEYVNSGHYSNLLFIIRPTSVSALDLFRMIEI